MKYAASTTISNVSAVSSLHKISGWNDPGNFFLIKKMLAGAKNVEGAFDVRLPITQNILEKIISLVPFVIESHYVQVTVQTMFAIAFYGLMRVSEICPKENKGSLCKKVLQFDDVGFNRKNGITSLFVTIRHFEHNKSHRPVTLVLQKQSGLSCPVKLMKKYLKLRKIKNGT